MAAASWSDRRSPTIGEIVIVTVRGVAVKLEAGGGANATGLAEEFARAKTTA